MEDKNLVTCVNCGAQFDIHEPKCPFCGHINPVGAEEKYMQGMQDIQLNLAQVDDQHYDEIKKEAGKVWKIVIITILAIILLIVFTGLLIFLANKKLNQYSGVKVYETDSLAAAKWNDAHLDEMEAMYEAGDIDGLVNYYDELINNGDLGAFNNWEHGFLISQIHSLRFWTKYLDDSGELDSLTVHQVMFNILYFYNGDYKGTTMPKEDYDLIMDDVQKSMEKASKRFGLSVDDIKNINDECVGQYGYVDPELVSKYCDAHKDIFK